MGVIVPGIFTDPWFSSLSLEERIFWIGLIALEECGCVEVDPEFLRAKIFPKGNWKTREKIGEMLQKFARDGKIVFYGGGRYLYLINCLKYRGYGNHPKPKLPLPPWLEWRPYPGKPRAEGETEPEKESGKGKLFFDPEKFNQVNNPSNNPLNYPLNNTQLTPLITPLIRGSLPPNEPLSSSPEGASNLNSCVSKMHSKCTKSALRKGKEREGKDIYNKDSQNENPSLSEKKETYPLSGSQSSLSQSLKEQYRSKEEPTPQMLRHQPPTLQEGLEAIPDPEERQKVKEGIDEFLKTHCV